MNTTGAPLALASVREAVRVTLARSRTATPGPVGTGTTFEPSGTPTSMGPVRMGTAVMTNDPSGPVMPAPRSRPPCRATIAKPASAWPWRLSSRPVMVTGLPAAILTTL